MPHPATAHIYQYRAQQCRSLPSCLRSHTRDRIPSVDSGLSVGAGPSLSHLSSFWLFRTFGDNSEKDLHFCVNWDRSDGPQAGQTLLTLMPTPISSSFHQICGRASFFGPPQYSGGIRIAKKRQLDFYQILISQFTHMFVYHGITYSTNRIVRVKWPIPVRTRIPRD